MRWSERQIAMLREMGIRVWSREASAAEGMAAAGDEALVVEETPPFVAEGRSAATVSVVRHEAPRDRPAPTAPALGPGALPTLAAADWLLVGEPFDVAGDPSAAAEHERLLDNMLHAIQVSRTSPGREGRACHLPIGVGRPVDLDEAMARVGPRCILAFGRAAASVVLGLDEPPGRLRERLHERGGVPVVVTFALPYLLRHPVDKAKAWADLCRAVSALG
ncbi:MAG: hypothetical protein ABI460_00255 [Caldimonas sp.]